MKPAKIPLSGKYGKGKYTLVDVEDVEKVASYKWHVSDNGYVINRTHGKTVRIHRLIMNTPKYMDTDHINHNKLDNRKTNLRICTRSANLRNRLDVKGYYYSKKRNKYIVDSTTLGIKWKSFSKEKEAKQFVSNLRKKLNVR